MNSKPSSTNLATVRRGRYKLDPAHSNLLFSVSHFGISTYYGEFQSPRGELEIASEVKGNFARLAVSVPVANVRTTSTVLDRELRSSEWLDGDQFPQITFDFEAPVSLSNDAFQVIGSLTLHGVTQNVCLDARFIGAGLNPKKNVYTIGFDIQGRIRRSDFGVTAALPMIGDELTVIISTAFEFEAEIR